MTTDASAVLVDGPWQHRFVSANGSRFHVAECAPAPPSGAPTTGEAPLVLLLHGFPQTWWAWRHQLPALAAAGYRAVAMDLRGFGGSDKPPRGYDTFTLAADVAGVIRSLGESRAVVVGHGWGAWIAWAMPAMQPRRTRAVAALGTAHPLRTFTALHDPANLAGLQHVLAFQAPVHPERQLLAGGYVTELLERWSGPGWPSPEEAEHYERAIAIPSVAHSAMEYYRWAFRSRVRADGWRFSRTMRRTITVPVLQLHGALDTQVPPAQARGSSRWVRGDYSWHLLDDAGHFLAEEAPDQVTALLTEWLDDLA